MAKEEKIPELLPYIQYESDSSSKEPDEYSTTDFQDYWRKRLAKKHRMSGPPWTIKDRTLWKKLVSIYPPEDLVLMIDYWMSTPDIKHYEFVRFYVLAAGIYHKIKKKDYTWE